MADDKKADMQADKQIEKKADKSAKGPDAAKKYIASGKIVRVSATDIDGNFRVRNALRKIKGISFMFANAVCTSSNVDPSRKLETLSESEIKTVEGFIANPNFPLWMLNRRRDFEKGIDIHMTGATLDFRKKEDINAMKKMRCYKGIRHELGQPVKGQRT